MTVLGAKRTDIHWLRSYLGYDFPVGLSDEDFLTIRSKLLTTEVFTDVKVRAEPVKGSRDHYELVIELNEKWTNIPVLRGAYGGGTPFTVLGTYDTHTLGRLWTVGAEAQRYGNAPWGSVVWARAPRFLQGYHEVGIEYWRQFRIRSIYDHNDDKQGELRSDWSMARVMFMAPTPVTREWKVGLDMRYRQEAPIHYQAEEEHENSPPPRGIRLTDDKSRQFNPMFRTIYDDMSVENLFHNGYRLIGNIGPVFEKSETHSRFEIEAFDFYWFPGTQFNLGLHAFLGQTTSDSLENQYFLGGFESVRGIPDGVIYGNRAFYTNVELRHLSYRFKYTWVQSAVFTDFGGAGPDWLEAKESVRSSLGVGLRFAVPQIYRLLFRLDYAWSLDKAGTSGISLGMNQFFQPYKPL